MRSQKNMERELSHLWSGYAFFGTSFTSVQAIEEAVKQKGARFVCLDLGRLSGMDCTFADQIRLLVLSLERDLAAVKR